MVKIERDLADYIRKELPNAHICKTMKRNGGSKGSYYVEETRAVMNLIMQYNKDNNRVILEYPSVN